MDDILKEIHCTDAKDFISKFSYGGEYFHLRNENFIFRGEPSDQYSLIPSSLREKNRTNIERIIRNFIPEFSKDIFDLSIEYHQITSEYILLSMFFRECDRNGLYIPDITDLRSLAAVKIPLQEELDNIEKWLPLNYIELAGLAQHYGIYTRLLDWSFDFNVALYFAVSGYMLNKTDNHPKNIVIWALNTEIVVNNKFDMTGLKITVPKYNSNPNLCAQKGVFTLWQITNTGRDFEMHTNRAPLDQLIKKNSELIITNTKNGNPLYKIYIPVENYHELKTYLETSGYDSARLFPGYGGAAKYILNNL